MKCATVAVLIANAVLFAGCVTEGAPPPRPQSDEEAAIANMNLGIGYIREDRPDVAVPALQRAIDLNPRLADAHTAIAVAYDQLEQIELAEEHHRQATRLAPQDADSQNAFAVFLCRQNRWTDAQPYFDRAIANSRSGSADAIMVNAATCARGAGNLVSAENYFRRALEDEPGNTEALRGLMDVSVRSENYLAGRAFWQRLDRAAQASPARVEPEDLYLCIVIEQQLDDDIAAQDCRSRLLRDFPTSPQASRLRELDRDGG
jgi:type IV pilus assembly protein PilF